MPVRLVSQERLPPPLEGYVLLERLGRGGFGDVWKAEAPGGLHKAIKFVFGDLDSQEEEHNRAAEQELKALERVKLIRHPYILSLERYDKIDGQLIIVMELADRNLWDRLRECQRLGMPGIPREELLKYLEEAAEALDLMNNRHNIQHLDVKPQNLFLVYNHVKVGDFGLAKLLEGVTGTVTGGVTPVYAGPETFEGRVSRYTDQYSLAIVFQELLTGTRPFAGSNTKQLLLQHLNGTPDLAALSAADRPIIARALSKKPEQRWPSCMEMVQALKQHSGAIAMATTRPSRSSGISNLVTRVSPSDPQAQTPPPSGRPCMPAGPTLPATPLSASRNPPAVRSPSPFGNPAGPSSNTPLPALVTPRMATSVSSTSGNMPVVTLQRPPIIETARAGTLGLAPPERTGSGVLLPALIVAVGRTGFLALKKLQAAIAERFGSLDAAPHIRYLYIDTDPEIATDDTSPTASEPPSYMVLARLHRPHHYLQPRDGVPSVESWMPSGQLYRLPRNPGPTGGVRALGRLALMDNYRAILQRLRQEISVFTSDSALDQAAERTGLGIRSNRVRVYLLAGLAGGTGGGMFLDLAYLLKHELRQIGYLRPDTVGVLFLPPVDASIPKNPRLANAYAALSEFAYFHGGRNRYQVRFDTRESALSDSEGPFSRCTVIQLPVRTDLKYLDRTVGVAARGLFLDLFTPAGRTVDAVREEAAKLNVDGVPVVSTFGLYRLSWPRPEMLAVATRHFARRLLEHWTATETNHLRMAVQVWLEEQWRVRELELEAVVARFEAVIRESLHDEPEKLFDAAVNSLRTQPTERGRAEAEAAATVLDQLFRIVGRPDEEKGKPGHLAAVLAAKHRQVAAHAEKQLAALSVHFIEQSQYRLAGADEALSQIEEKLKRTVDGLVNVRQTLAEEVHAIYYRLFVLIGGVGSGSIRRSVLTAELLEKLRLYPRKRLKLLILDQTLALYRAMLLGTPELIRDVHTCRVRLTEMIQSIGSGSIGVEGAGPGRMILPHGVEGLGGAADLFLNALPPEELFVFDQMMQQEVQKKFKAVLAVCVQPENTEPFLQLLLAKSREFLDARLEKADPATAFFQYRGADASGVKMVTRAFEAALPDLAAVSGRRPMEANILACPMGADGERFRSFCEQTLPEVNFIPAPLPDDITFLREYPLVPLAELPQLGPPARDAYDIQMHSDQSPHSRVDVPWTAPGADSY